MRLAAVQFKADKGSYTNSLSRLSALLNRAATGADLVVCPEMALSGYMFSGPDAIATVAEPARGRSYECLAPVARRERCWLVVGFPEVDRDRYFNSAMVINPCGELVFCYRKTLLYQADEAWASPGDSGYRYFDTDWGRFAPGICMDLNDDAFIGWCSASRLDALAFPTNWIEEGVDVWRYWAWRLHGLDAALVAANSYGSEGDTLFTGRSAILMKNCVHAAVRGGGDGVIKVEL